MGAKAEAPKAHSFGALGFWPCVLGVWADFGDACGLGALCGQFRGG